MAVNQYIGSRYVPLFADPIEWSASNTYEPLTIVIHEGNSYTSKQAVPKGIDIANETYWVLTGNYNAQVELYRRETALAKATADDAQADATAAQTDIDTLLPKADFSAENTVKKYVDDSVAEVQTDIDTLLPKSAFNADKTVLARIEGDVLAFENVAAMRASENLKDGMVCHTNGFHSSSDGGAAYYEIVTNATPNGIDVIECGNLYAKLVYQDSVVDAQLGCAGDGITDDAEILQYGIDVSVSKKLPFVMVQNHLVKTSLQVNENYTKIYASGTITIDEDIPAITLSANRCVIVLNKIVGDGTGSGILVYKGSNDGLGVITSFNTIKFNSIENCECGILCRVEAGYGIQYNTFDFEYINCDECIVYDVANSKGSWITQQTFEHGRLSGGIGFHVLERENMDSSNGNVFYNVGFEGLTRSAVVAYKLSGSQFVDIRMLENDTMQDYYIDLNVCDSNLFSGAINLPLTKLRDVNPAYNSEVQNTKANYFDCAVILTDVAGGFVGTKLRSNNGVKFIEDCCRHLGRATVTDRNADLGSETAYLYDGIWFNGGSSGSNDITYTLPWEFFRSDRYITFSCAFKTGRFKIVSPNGEVFADQDDFEAGKTYRLSRLSAGFGASIVTYTG